MNDLKFLPRIRVYDSFNLPGFPFSSNYVGITIPGKNPAVFCVMFSTLGRVSITKDHCHCLQRLCRPLMAFRRFWVCGQSSITVVFNLKVWNDVSYVPHLSDMWPCKIIGEEAKTTHNIISL